MTFLTVCRHKLHLWLIFFTSWRYANAVYAVVMYLSPSVRLSVTSRHCTKTAKRRITQTKPYDSLGTLVFCSKKSRQIPKSSLPTGAPNRGGRLKSESFDLYRYISETVQNRNIHCSYYRKLIGTRMYSTNGAISSDLEWP